ncbi:hypothetical protein ACJX0J_032149, partial [Zea mays]
MWLHLQPKWKPSLSWFKNAESRLNHHLSGLFGKKKGGNFLSLYYYSMDKAEIDRENTESTYVINSVKRNRDREHATLQGDSGIAEAWFDQAVEYWKQAIALTPGNYIETTLHHHKKVDNLINNSNELSWNFESNKKIYIMLTQGKFFRDDRYHDTTTWIWNLHADAHDFDSYTGDLEISRKWHAGRASGITSEFQLYCTVIGALIFVSLMLFAGPKLAWFQD